MRLPLVPLEEKVYRCLLDFLAEHTFQPSVRDIARACRIPSTKTVADLLGLLEQKGYVQREKGRSRGLRLLGWSGPAGTMPVPVVEPLDEPAQAGTAGGAADGAAADVHPLVAANAAAAGMRVIAHLALDARLLPAPDAILVRLAPTVPGAEVALDALLLVLPSARAEDGALVAARIGRRVEVRQVARGGGPLTLEHPSAPPVAVGSEADAVVLGPVVSQWGAPHIV